MLRSAAHRRVLVVLVVLVALVVVASCVNEQGDVRGDGPPAGAEPLERPEGRPPSSSGEGQPGARVTKMAQAPSMVTSIVGSADGRSVFVGERDGRVHRIDLVDGDDGYVVPAAASEPVVKLRST